MTKASEMSDRQYQAALDHLARTGTLPQADTPARLAAGMTDREFADALAHLQRTGSLPV